MGRKNGAASYNIKDTTLETVKVERDLGVLISDDLKVSQQCAKAVKTSNRVLGMIKRTFNSRKSEVIIPLYKSLVRPHLEYCVQAWRPHLVKDIQLIEAVQHRATKCVEGMSVLSYEERLRRLKLPSLEYRRIRGDLIQVFKVYKGWAGLEFGELFQANHNTLRGHSAKLFKKRVYSDIGKFSFSNRVVDLWNSLPSDIIDCSSLNEFKNKLDIYLRVDRGIT